MALRARLRGSYPVAVEGVSPIAVTRTNGRDRITLDATAIPSEDLSVAVTGVEGSSAYSQAHMLAAVPRRITSGSTVTVASNDSAIFIDKSSVTTVNLPLTATRAGLELYVIDLGRTSGDYPITINASGSETINGSTAYVLEAPGASVLLSPNAEAGKWTVTQERLGYAFNYCGNGEFEGWLSEPPTTKYVDTAGDTGFNQREIADGWYAAPQTGAPGTPAKVRFSREVYDAGTGTFAGKFEWLYPARTGEAQHAAAPTATKQRGTIIEYNNRLKPSVFAGKNVTFRFKAKASGSLTLIPVIYTSMGLQQRAASTVVPAGSYRLNSTGEFSTTQKIYYTALGGTTGAGGGPTGTGSSIADGTVTWAYFGEAKGRDYEVYQAGGVNTRSIAWGDAPAAAQCAITTSWQEFSVTIYVPELDEGTGTTYSGQPNDNGSRTFVPIQGSGAYTGMGWDFQWTGDQGPTIYIADVHWFIGANVKAEHLPLPAGIIDAINISDADWLIYNGVGTAGETTVASASTVDLSATSTRRVYVTGTTTINSFGSGGNTIREIRFASTPTVTHSSSLVIPRGSDVTARAGDCITVASATEGMFVVTNAPPHWYPVVLTSDVSGILPVANGGVEPALTYVRGMSGVNNSGTPNSQFDLTCTSVRLSTGSAAVVVAGSTITNNISTAGSAANGRDQAGSFTNGSWIHFWWIYNGTTLATLSSASSSSPTLPSGYTYKAYAGCCYLESGGTLRKAHIQGDAVFVQAAGDATALNAGTTSGSETSISLSAVVPANAIAVNYLAAVTSANTSASGTFNFRHTTGSNFIGVWATQKAAIDTWANATFTMPYKGSTIYYFTSTSSLTGYLYVHSFTIPNGAW